MPRQLTAADRILERYQAYLETLSFILIDPRAGFSLSDVVNRTLLEAYRELDLLQGLDEAARKRRLQRMLRNNLLEQIKFGQAQMRDYRRQVALDEALSRSSCNVQRWMVYDTPSPDERAEGNELGEQLAQALAELPPRQREAMILQKYHGWKLAEIAERLGCTIGAVAGLHAQGVKRLRKLLSEPGDDWEE
jgi:RNA polymerase sigma factor (sigma-70 family)